MPEVSPTPATTERNRALVIAGGAAVAGLLAIASFAGAAGTEAGCKPPIQPCNPENPMDDCSGTTTMVPTTEPGCETTTTTEATTTTTEATTTTTEGTTTTTQPETTTTIPGATTTTAPETTVTTAPPAVPVPEGPAPTVPPQNPSAAPTE